MKIKPDKSILVNSSAPVESFNFVTIRIRIINEVYFTYRFHNEFLFFQKYSFYALEIPVKSRFYI